MTAGPADRTATVAGLQLGTAYAFQVTALYDGSPSQTSARTATIVTGLDPREASAVVVMPVPSSAAGGAVLESAPPQGTAGVRACRAERRRFSGGGQADPGNEDAKFNLELLLRQLVARGSRPGSNNSSGGPGERASGRRRRPAGPGVLIAASLEFLTPLGGLLALTAIVPAAALALASRREHRGTRALGLPLPPRTRRLPLVLAVAAVPALLGLAATQPVLRSTTAVELRTDAEVFFVIDTSRSMLALLARLPGPRGWHEPVRMPSVFATSSRRFRRA